MAKYILTARTNEDLELLSDVGKAIPFVKNIIFSLEKEEISRWNKFMQGYYDISGISSDHFQQAINVNPTGGLNLSDNLKNKGFSLQVSTSPSIMYWSFNMLDPIVGGYSEDKKSLT